MGQDLFIYLDGDKIGDRFELLLLNNNVSDSIKLSHNINTAINRLRTTVEMMDGAEVLFMGGDDAFVRVKDDTMKIKEIEALREQFYNLTGCSLSGGIGVTPKDAIDNLRIAKLSGRNRLIHKVH